MRDEREQAGNLRTAVAQEAAQPRRARFKYVQSFTDRYGTTRHYLRLKGSRPAPLPRDMESEEFTVAYKRLIAEARLRPTGGPFARLQKADAEDAWPEAAGVYLLMLAGEIVYIGTSGNLRSRVAAHRAAGRPFDNAHFIHADGSDRTALERALILALRPAGNKALLRPLLSAVAIQDATNP